MLGGFDGISTIDTEAHTDRQTWSNTQTNEWTVYLFRSKRMSRTHMHMGVRQFAIQQTETGWVKIQGMENEKKIRNK